MKECKGRDAGARSKRTRRDAPLPNDWQPPTAPQALERFTSLPQGRGGIRALPGRSPNFGEAQAAMRLAMQGGRGQQARGSRGLLSSQTFEDLILRREYISEVLLDFVPSTL